MSQITRAHGVTGPGEDALLATAIHAQALGEALMALLTRLHDFADWQLLNVTEAQACSLEPEFAALGASFAELTAGTAGVLGEVDGWCARLVPDWPDSDELFELNMGRLSDRGDPRWRALAAWWRHAFGDLDDRSDVDDDQAEPVWVDVDAEVSGRG
jgi:hypothetical protein